LVSLREHHEENNFKYTPKQCPCRCSSTVTLHGISLLGNPTFRLNCRETGTCGPIRLQDLIAVQLVKSQSSSACDVRSSSLHYRTQQQLQRTVHEELPTLTAQTLGSCAVLLQPTQTPARTNDADSMASYAPVQ
jgi:hypothetical protein